MRQPTDVLVEFITVWGHPTRYEIYGPGDQVWVSRRIAGTLINGKYVKEIKRA